jgi:hypothetical protein
MYTFAGSCFGGNNITWTDISLSDLAVGEEREFSVYYDSTGFGPVTEPMWIEIVIEVSNPAVNVSEELSVAIEP